MIETIDAVVTVTLVVEVRGVTPWNVDDRLRRLREDLEAEEWVESVEKKVEVEFR